MKPNHENVSSSKKRPMTPAERARRYRERRKLKLLGISTNLLEQALNVSTRCMFPEELRKGGNENWRKDVSEHHGIVDSTTCCNQEKEIYETSKNTGIVIKIEPGLSDIIHQANLSQDDTEDYIGGCNRLKENNSELHDSIVDVDNPTFCKQEDENHLNSKNTSIDIKKEPDLTDFVSQDDVSQDDTTKDSIPGCSRLKKGVSELVDCIVEVDHTTNFYQEKDGNDRNCENTGIGIKENSSTMRFHSIVEEFVDAEKTSKTGVENCQTTMRDQQQQTNEIPIAAIAERWMINWNGDQPIAEPVLSEVKRPMTAAERKRKSREKQRAEAKFFLHKPESCSCGTNFKTRDKLKAEVDALTHRKELLSAQITLLQAQPQQVKLGLTENDSEDDLSNVSTNDSSTECSRFKEISFDAHTKLKRTISVDRDHEINNDSIIKKTFFGMLDDFQVFGEFVATELRNLKNDVNRRRLKRMIQKVIIEVSESED